MQTPLAVLGVAHSYNMKLLPSRRSELWSITIVPLERSRHTCHCLNQFLFAAH